MTEIDFKGSFYKFTTTPDGGGRITFEVPQSELHMLYEVMELRAQLLKITISYASPNEHENELK